MWAKPSVSVPMLMNAPKVVVRDWGEQQRRGVKR